LSKTVGEGAFELRGGDEGAPVGSTLLEGADDVLGAGVMVGTLVGSEVLGVGPLEGTNEGISDGTDEEKEGDKVGTAVGKEAAGGLVAEDEGLDPSNESKTVGEGAFELRGGDEGASVSSTLLEGVDDVLGAGVMVGTLVGSEVLGVGPLEGTNEGISDGMEEEKEGGKVGTAVGKEAAGGLVAEDEGLDMDIEKDMTSTSLSITSSSLG
jgi:hypothetical protein